MLMETSWSRRWNWEKPRRSKLCHFQHVQKLILRLVPARALTVSLSAAGWPQLWVHCTDNKTRWRKSFSFVRASLSFKNLFFLQAGGQDLTEEEVAKLDLELEMELDDVNAENIDWIISLFFLPIGWIRQIMNWRVNLKYNSFFCCCNPVCHLP